jgi:hypothetical protein
VHLERANDTVRPDKTQHRGRAQGKALEPGTYREPGVLGLNRILDQCIEQSLLPVQIGRGIERRAGDVSQRAVVTSKRRVRRKRHADGGDLRREPAVALVQFQFPGDPDNCGITQRLVDARQIDIPGTALWHIHVPQRFHGDADEEMQRAILRPEIRLDHDIVRNVVRERGW